MASAPFPGSLMVSSAPTLYCGQPAKNSPPPAHGLNSAGSLRIPGPAPPSCYPAPLFEHSAPKLGDQLEICSAMSLLVITHHDSYKFAFITFPFHHVTVAVFR